MLALKFSDSFQRNLPADPIVKNMRRQVLNACYSYVTPKIPGDPGLVHLSKEMIRAIGLRPEDAQTEDFLQVFSGARVIKGTHPYAMCYGGHQFGHWAGQLGDGRAINLGEVVHNGKRWALQLKGAGETPYSRNADGLAVLRSSIREHLCSEAMHHLGIPTTRSLSLMLTGDQVLRDVLYDGNSAYEKGAVVCRVAPSFIRFGNFEILSARQDHKNLKKLTDYTIKYFYPHIETGTKQGYIDFFRQVTERTLDMVLHWQRVGFVHGVMNTDNMSILGLTIDYGPYGWLEGYDTDWTPNTTDRQGKRYRYSHQPQIALWNVYQLANALYLLIEESGPLEEILDWYKIAFSERSQKMMRDKLGLADVEDEDEKLITDLTEVLTLTETDMTIFFRLLANVSVNQSLHTKVDITNILGESFYAPHELQGSILKRWVEWLARYQDRLKKESISHEIRQSIMHATNPKYVLRNYMAQMAIDQADTGDYSLIDELYKLLKTPYAENLPMHKWFAKRPEWARHKVGCSMLSCSS